MNLDNAMTIGDYYPAPRRISDEDCIICVECGDEYHVDDLGGPIRQTCFGAVCKGCRIWCKCGDVLVESKGDLCSDCQEAAYDEYIDRKLDEWRDTGERPFIRAFRGGRA